MFDLLIQEETEEHLGCNWQRGLDRFLFFVFNSLGKKKKKPVPFQRSHKDVSDTVHWWRPFAEGRALSHESLPIGELRYGACCPLAELLERGPARTFPWQPRPGRVTPAGAAPSSVRWGQGCLKESIVPCWGPEGTRTAT